MRKVNTTIYCIGQQADHTSPITDISTPNIIKKAQYYKRILDEGLANSQADLAKQLDIGRSSISLRLRLLNLDDDIVSFIANLEDNDPLLTDITEKTLRPLLDIENPENQKKALRKIVV